MYMSNNEYMYTSMKDTITDLLFLFGLALSDPAVLSLSSTNSSVAAAAFYKKNHKLFKLVYYCYYRNDLIIHTMHHTVEPPSKGHFGTMHFDTCREAVLFSEIENVSCTCRLLVILEVSFVERLSGSFISTPVTTMCLMLFKC